ncbi:hypothetical protein CPB83DRAFT_268472 [Crepidotus variabilis]|uniref:Uncharacterized protein n=1 Tax=Crepidotus variabilis TaxID=179855 RepID=A0A9P6JR93_9AGAR|nr:hypothetical protein CPB83DRAFT_268472 [Crepidotus variabilis]
MILRHSGRRKSKTPRSLVDGGVPSGRSTSTRRLIESFELGFDILAFIQILSVALADERLKGGGNEMDWVRVIVWYGRSWSVIEVIEGQLGVGDCGEAGTSTDLVRPRQSRLLSSTTTTTTNFACRFPKNDNRTKYTGHFCKLLLTTQ